MLYVALLLLLSVAGCYIAFREHVDEGSMGLLGAPALGPAVFGAMLLLAGPAWQAIHKALPGFTSVWVFAGLVVPLGPYFAGCLGRSVGDLFTGSPSAPARKYDIFSAARQAVRVNALPEAIQEYDRILRQEVNRLKPEQVGYALERLADLHHHMRDYESALAAADRAQASGTLPAEAELRLDLVAAEALEQMDRTDDAVARLTRAQSRCQEEASLRENWVRQTVEQRLAALQKRQATAPPDLDDLDFSDEDEGVPRPMEQEGDDLPSLGFEMR